MEELRPETLKSAERLFPVTSFNVSQYLNSCVIINNVEIWIAIKKAQNFTRNASMQICII